MKKMSFEEFCYEHCDELYNPKMDKTSQCTGYYQLKKMVTEKIEPANMEEIERWESNPTMDELLSPPDIKYLRFLHTNLRKLIIDNWKHIKKLKVE